MIHAVEGENAHTPTHLVRLWRFRPHTHNAAAKFPIILFLLSLISPSKEVRLFISLQVKNVECGQKTGQTASEAEKSEISTRIIRISGDYYNMHAYVIDNLLV